MEHTVLTPEELRRLREHEEQVNKAVEETGYPRTQVDTTIRMFKRQIGQPLPGDAK